MNKAVFNIYMYSYFAGCSQGRCSYSVVYLAALLLLSCCPFAAVHPWKEPMPCFLQTTNSEYPEATAERQNEKGAETRALAACQSLAQRDTLAWLVHRLPRHLLPTDLMSFKCPLVAVPLPGGHVSVMQVEEKSTLHAHVKHNRKAHVWKMAAAH